MRSLSQIIVNVLFRKNGHLKSAHLLHIHHVTVGTKYENNRPIRPIGYITMTSLPISPLMLLESVQCSRCDCAGKENVR